MLGNPGIKQAEYFDFLTDWRFELAQQQPLQTIKSFIIVLTGCETAQRVNEKSITFVLMDAGKIWEKAKIKAVLEGSLERLKEKLHLARELEIDFIDILGEREVGKYYCARCGMFFEFGLKREQVTCPLMAQKCMFEPQQIEKAKYTADELVKQYTITPDIYLRFMRAAGAPQDLTQALRNLLQEWKISENQDKILKLLVPQGN